MKRHFFLTLLALISVTFIACDNSITDMGKSIQPAGDTIMIASETFDINSETYFAPYMYAIQDSFLIGTFNDSIYGTTHADVLAQVKYPENFVYYEGTVPDSIFLRISYNTFFGDGKSPVHLSVYEMDKGTFNFLTPYPSNLNPEDYSSRTPANLLGEKTFTAISSTDSTYVYIKLKDSFLQRFTDITEQTYTSNEDFLNFFKGLYITADFGSATMLYASKISLMYYHHYTYNAPGYITPDSVYTVNNMVPFPANEEVRQVNRFLHPDTTAVKNRLAQESAQGRHVNYISSPANAYTRISLPLKAMQEKMETSGFRLAINYANLRVDIDTIYSKGLVQYIPTYILMIKESEADNFFKQKDLPDGTYAVLGSYSYDTNSDTDETEYYYSFDLSSLLAYEFKNSHEGSAIPEEEKYLLIPVRVSYNSSSSITKIMPQYIMSAVTVCAGNHSYKPMKARVVYSGF